MAKKHDVPDIDSLLGTIADKRAELPKTEIQHVQPVGESTASLSEPTREPKPEVSKAGKTAKPLPASQDDVSRGGRPSFKRSDIEYVKLSPRVPKQLKKHADLALIEERFDGPDGKPVKTMDVLVELALTRLLQKK